MYKIPLLWQMLKYPTVSVNKPCPHVTKKSQDRDVAAIDIYLKYSKIKDTTIVSCVGVVIYTLLNYIHNSYWIISKTLHSIKQQVSMFVMRRLFPHHPVG